MPTIFDSSLEEQRKKQQEIEKKLVDIQTQAKEKNTGSSKKESVFELSQKNVELDESAVANMADSSESAAQESEENTMHTELVEEKKSSRKPEDYSSLLREEGSSNGMFSSFMPQPPGVGFESQHENEKILLVLRQHPAVNLVWIFTALILILAPFLLFPLIPLQVVLPGNFLFFLMIAWYLFVTAFVVESFLGWYFNIYVITDERIIDIDFYSLIYKSVSEAKLDKIEDVTATTAGFFGAFFNFGNITIQTAAEKREFDFQKVPQPAKVTKFLNELILEEEREKIEGRVM